MRIVGGDKKGMRLAAPKDNTTRPTTDRVREAVFNILAHRTTPMPAGCRVLDLFAGTGAMGLEALSRGAAHATFVERSKDALKHIESNISALGYEEQARILPVDATRLMRAPDACELIFVDPPYKGTLAARALARAHAKGWVAEGAVIVVEAAQGEPNEMGAAFVLEDTRQYGRTQVSIFTCP